MSTTVVNECIPAYEDGTRLTAYCEAAVTGKRFVAISDPKKVAFAALSSSVDGGNIVVSPCGAGAKAIGVGDMDAAISTLVGVLRGHMVVPVTSGAAVVAGVEVESDATGRAITLNTGKSLGVALTSAGAAGTDILVALNL